MALFLWVRLLKLVFSRYLPAVLICSYPLCSYCKLLVSFMQSLIFDISNISTLNAAYVCTPHKYGFLFH